MQGEAKFYSEINTETIYSMALKRLYTVDRVRQKSQLEGTRTNCSLQY